MNTQIKENIYCQLFHITATKYGLKGNEIIIYSIIDGYTKSKSEYFKGGRQYLATCINSTKKSVDAVLEKLIEKKIVVKIPTNDIVKYYYQTCDIPTEIVEDSTEELPEENNEELPEEIPEESAEIIDEVGKNLPQCKNFPSEDITPEGSKKFPSGREEITLVVGKNLPQGREEITPSIISTKKNIKKNNIKDNIKTKDKEVVVYYPLDEKLNDALLEFIIFRKKIKAPMTEHAIELMIKKLDGMTDSNDDKIEILEQSILNGWKGIFELKNSSSSNNKNNNGAEDYNATVRKIYREECEDYGNSQYQGIFTIGEPT